ncbi:MAG: polar amino acid ABC transporter permease [Clostridium sp. CAG:354_28_25]|nr:MAG: polar amino acid ABC transporter permease [Clostridium sp. CAG:354_28_25]
MENFLNLLKILSEGLGTTLLIFLLTLGFGIPAGILVAVARNSKCKLVNLITKLYILIIRGTPMMLQIIFIYFAPYYLFKVTYDRFIAIIIAFVVNYAAYFAEIFRSGILSIPKGQKEAAFTLGFSKTQTFFRILLPQIVKRILPAMSNEVISLIKTTSLAQIIGITEIFALAQKQASYQFSILPLCVAGLMYLVLCTIITYAFNKAEKKYSYYTIT